MEFGKVDDPGKIDFSLPPDDPLTDELFSRLVPGNQQPLRVYVGGTNWGTKDWVGTLYPKKTKEKDFLAHYTRQFNTIELNTLFYNLQSKSVIEKWALTAGDNFLFCPKFLNTISHTRQLENVRPETDAFIDHMQYFGTKLGPSFLQLSDSFVPERATVLQQYVRQLPRDFRVCVELRHEDWFGTGGYAQAPGGRNPARTVAVRDTRQLLTDLGIGSVITDTSGRRDVLHMTLTAPFAFIRFVGNNGHPTDFARLDEWALRLKRWIDKGLREIYFFIHSHHELHSPELARYAVERFNRVCGTRLAPPVLSNGGQPENLSLF